MELNEIAPEKTKEEAVKQLIAFLETTGQDGIILFGFKEENNTDLMRFQTEGKITFKEFLRAKQALQQHLLNEVNK